MSQMPEDLQLPLEASESDTFTDLSEVRKQEALETDEPLRHDEGARGTGRDTGRRRR